jgi:AcrR family transcriptional regulator
MGSTRAVLLAAALQLVAERGTRRTSMTDIAVAAGVAKGTLYNHFRTKDEIWSAVVTAEIRGLAAECAPLPLADALVLAAGRLAGHAALRRLAAEEPATLAVLLSAPAAAPGRAVAAQVVGEHLAAAGRDTAAADLVLRWLDSHLAGLTSTAESAHLLANLLPASTIDLG